MTIRNAADAAHTADQLLAILRSQEKILSDGPETGVAADIIFPLTIDQALTGRRREYPPPLLAELNALPKDIRRYLLSVAQDAGMRRLWQQHRIVYEIDSDAWDSIGDASTTMEVPADALTQLPHPNPLLVFPEPIVLDLGGGQRQRVVGAYIVGNYEIGPNQRVVCSSDNPGVTGWTFTFAGLVETAAGHPMTTPDGGRDLVLSRTSLDLVKGFTLGELIQRSIRQFRPMTGPGGSAVGNHPQDLPKLLSRAINMVVYLCAVNADLRPLPANPTSRRRNPGQPKPPRVISVGFRVGTTLRAWRRAVAEGGIGTGGTKAPHIRRSHPHTFLYGPGRQQRRMKWLWPIPVNMDFQKQDETTIIPIRGSGA
jgi:hypothetical protein